MINISWNLNICASIYYTWADATY